MQTSSASSDEDTGVGDSSFDKTSSTNAAEADTELRNDNDEISRLGRVPAAGGDSTVAAEDTNATIVSGGTSGASSSPNSNGKTVVVVRGALSLVNEHVKYGLCL